MAAVVNDLMAAVVNYLMAAVVEYLMAAVNTAISWQALVLPAPEGLITWEADAFTAPHGRLVCYQSWCATHAILSSNSGCCWGLAVSRYPSIPSSDAAEAEVRLPVR